MSRQSPAPAAAKTAAAELARGAAVLLADDADDGDADGGRASLILAAELADARSIAFMVRHTSGFLCASMTEADCDRLDLPPMVHAVVEANQSGLAFAVSTDARIGTTTGISAHDRALTFNALADRRTVVGDLIRPGHVVPLRGRNGGVLERAGRAEAAVDLCRIGGLRPVAVAADLVTDAGAIPTRADLRQFRDEHGIAGVSIADVVAFRLDAEPQLTRTGSHDTTTPHGAFRIHTYESERGGIPHLALVRGDLAGGNDVLVRVHRSCVAGDVFGSRGCGCRAALAGSVAMIAREGRGLLVYLRGSGGRCDDDHARAQRGHQRWPIGQPPLDERELLTVTEILASEGVRSVRASDVHQPLERMHRACG